MLHYCQTIELKTNQVILFRFQIAIATNVNLLGRAVVDISECLLQIHFTK